MTGPRIVVVCTANQCRSPVAAALLARALARRGVEASVGSAGLMAGGEPAAAGMQEAAARLGLDLGGHRSRELDVATLRESDLVIGMARHHVRAAVVALPEVWPRSFTLRELVRRGTAAGGRDGGQDLAAWLAVVGGGRTHSDLLGSSPDDDVEDPMGGPASGYQRTAEELAGLVDALVDLAWPVS